MYKRQKKKLAMSPSCVVHGGQYDTKYGVGDIRVDFASGNHSWLTNLGRSARSAVEPPSVRLCCQGIDAGLSFDVWFDIVVSGGH